MPTIELTVHQYQELVRAAHCLAAMQANVTAELHPDSDAPEEASLRLLNHVVARGSRFGFPESDSTSWPEWTLPLFNDAKGYLSDYVQLRMWERLAEALAIQHYKRTNPMSDDTAEQRRAKVRAISNRIVEVLEANRDLSPIVIRGVTDVV